MPSYKDMTEAGVRHNDRFDQGWVPETPLESARILIWMGHVISLAQKNPEYLKINFGVKMMEWFHGLDLQAFGDIVDAAKRTVVPHGTTYIRVMGQRLAEYLAWGRKTA